MFRNRMISLGFMVLACSLLIISCSKNSSDEGIADDTAVVEGAPIAGSTIAAAAIQPSTTSTIEGTPEAVKMVEDAKKKDAEYQGEVVLKITEGGIQYNAIKSKSKCETSKDCTNTKYANVPKIDRDCTCAAACTPFVVSKTDKKLREAANEKLCDQNDWYGATCPAPPCSFMGFDFYRCIDNVCFGMAAGRN
jgi:hypothetical protein